MVNGGTICGGGHDDTNDIHDVAICHGQLNDVDKEDDSRLALKLVLCMVVFLVVLGVPDISVSMYVYI